MDNKTSHCTNLNSHLSPLVKQNHKNSHTLYLNTAVEARAVLLTIYIKKNIWISGPKEHEMTGRGSVESDLS